MKFDGREIRTANQFLSIWELIQQTGRSKLCTGERNDFEGFRFRLDALPLPKTASRHHPPGVKGPTLDESPKTIASNRAVERLLKLSRGQLAGRALAQARRVRFSGIGTLLPAT